MAIICERSSVKTILSLVCEIFVISFKNDVLLGWVGSRNCSKKLFAISNSFWCHFTARMWLHFYHSMDLTIASKKMLAE